MEEGLIICVGFVQDGEMGFGKEMSGAAARTGSYK